MRLNRCDRARGCGGFGGCCSNNVTPITTSCSAAPHPNPPTTQNRRRPRTLKRLETRQRAIQKGFACAGQGHGCDHAQLPQALSSARAYHCTSLLRGQLSIACNTKQPRHRSPSGQLHARTRRQAGRMRSRGNTHARDAGRSTANESASLGQAERGCTTHRFGELRHRGRRGLELAANSACNDSGRQPTINATACYTAPRRARAQRATHASALEARSREKAASVLEGASSSSRLSASDCTSVSCAASASTSGSNTISRPKPKVMEGAAMSGPA